MTTLIVTVIVAVLGTNGVTGLVSWFSGRGGRKAEAAGEITTAAIKLVDTMAQRLADAELSIAKTNAEIVVLQKHVADTDAQLRVLENGVATLTQQIKDLGATPKWVPPWTS